MKDGSDRLADGPLSGRDGDVVQAIGQEELSVFTFDGLRRIVRAHPETLSRSLQRLEDNGMLQRSEEGYTVTEKGKDAVAMKPAFGNERKVPILQTLTPYGLTTETVVSALKGRWFDKMRWVGMGEAAEGAVMKWVSENGSVLIDVRVWEGQLSVDAKVRTDSDLAEAVRAAHQVAAKLSKMYPPQRLKPDFGLLQIAYFPSAM